MKHWFTLIQNCHYYVLLLKSHNLRYAYLYSQRLKESILGPSISLCFQKFFPTIWTYFHLIHLRLSTF